VSNSTPISMASKGDRTRQRILDVVADLLQDSTYDEISVAEITRRATVTRPGFYFHFPTKGAAVASLMEGMFDQFIEIARGWYEHQGPDQVQAFRQGISDTVDLWRQEARLMHAMAQAAASDPHARAIWTGWIEQFSAAAVPTLSMDLPAGIARDQRTVKQVATMLVRMVFDAMQHDVESIVQAGSPTPELLETISFVWTRTVYGSAGSR